MIGAWIDASRNDAEAERAHALDQRLAVRRVAREPRRLAAFGRRTARARRRTPRRRASAACSATASSSPCRPTGRTGRARATSSGPRSPRASRDARSRSPCPAGLRCTCPTPRSPRRTASSRTSIGSAPNELIASTISRRPWRATTAAIAGERIQDAGRRLAMDEPDVRDRRDRCASSRSTSSAGRRHVVGGLEHA